MKALVVGGTGILSSDLVKVLMKNGWDVSVLNRGITPGAGEAETIICDAYDETAMAKAMEGRRYDVVVSFTGYLPRQVEGDIRVFSGKCDQYIFISTCAVYEKPDAMYLTTESSPLRNKDSEYGRLKIACEETLNHAYRDEDFPVTIVRPNWTYGVTTIPFIATSWCKPWTLLERIKNGKPVLMPGDGTSRFTLTHTLDLAEGIMGLMGNAGSIGHAFHITGDEALSWNQYLENIEKAFGYKANVVNVSTQFICEVVPQWHDDLFGDKIVTFLFDNSKIKRFVPGFCAKIPFSKGIRMSVEYVMEHPDRQVIDEEYTAVYDKIFSAYKEKRG